ncbi:MAG: IS30 family transposase [Nitrospirae bacterium]|nr:IS30 family transposase [Nitrospirota bacterium]
MSTYKQLTQEQRYQIYALKKMGHKPTQIARCLEVHKSTLSRELKRNSGLLGYRPQQAHKKALERQAQKVSRRVTSETWTLVEEKLHLDWSPEQISGWLKGNSDAQVSPPVITTQFIRDWVNALGHEVECAYRPSSFGTGLGQEYPVPDAPRGAGRGSDVYCAVWGVKTSPPLALPSRYVSVNR